MKHVTLDMIYEVALGSKMMSGGYLLLHCPFHDDTKASVLAYADGWYRCLGACDNSGPLFNLYAELISPGSVKRGTPERVGGYPPRIPSEPHQQVSFVKNAHQTLKRNTSFSWYIKQRGLEGRIETCYLGWHEGWLVIPVYSDSRDLLSIIIRSGPQAQKLTGLRFSQPTGQRAMMYCPDWSLLSRSDILYVVFGMIDALTLSELRLPVVTSTGGAMSFKAKWIKQWRKPVLVVPDAGEEPQAYHLLKNLGWRGKLKKLTYPKNYSDPNDYLAGGDGDALLKELVSG